MNWYAFCQIPLHVNLSQLLINLQRRKIDARVTEEQNVQILWLRNSGDEAQVRLELANLNSTSGTKNSALSNLSYSKNVHGASADLIFIGSRRVCFECGISGFALCLHSL
ncbi:MAG: rhomboid protease N-terminal domain-containing protein [Rhodococcus sp. (in: high G+C Gram-positive bacteria)]|uniref:rhomboid protease N-terminal domain-containing protein n=1 Tax=Rhodococcus sp. TaxID=1831 RepID=UPI002AD8A506|nr:rhomboid protease N-terminal domain-containing protein [Rhodococcus sp. (in: high G+C Gram-positive bacteria)]